MDAGYSSNKGDVTVTTSLLGNEQQQQPDVNRNFRRITYAGLVFLSCAVVALVVGLAVVGTRKSDTGTSGPVVQQGTNVAAQSAVPPTNEKADTKTDTNLATETGPSPDADVKPDIPGSVVNSVDKYVDAGSAGNDQVRAPQAPDCPANPSSVRPNLERAKCILDTYPLIDGHNDLAYQYLNFANNDVYSVDLKADLREVWHTNNSHTDIPRLREGHLGGQFWSCYVGCSLQYKDAVRASFDQLDTIKKFVQRYPDTFQFVTTSQGILDAFSRGRIASMVGLEGGHSIDSSISNLRLFYELGVRYMTLTHSCNTPWADNWMVDTQDYNATIEGPVHNGLTDFGKTIVKEMNRLGMLVDISHVAKETMIDAIRTSQAPVIFSHSSAFALCNHYRNVQDDVLNMTRENGGIVMVNFYDAYVNCPPTDLPRATVQLVADHVEYIKDYIGVDHVGIGADFDGIDTPPIGLEDVSKYPFLFEELLNRGWEAEDLQKLAGRNLVRVFKQAEKVRDQLSYLPPFEDHLPAGDEWPPNSPCRV